MAVFEDPPRSFRSLEDLFQDSFRSLSILKELWKIPAGFFRIVLAFSSPSVAILKDSQGSFQIITGFFKLTQNNAGFFRILQDRFPSISQMLTGFN